MGGPRIDVMVEEEERMQEEMVGTTGGGEIEEEEEVVVEAVETLEMELTEVEAVKTGSR